MKKVLVLLLALSLLAALCACAQPAAPAADASDSTDASAAAPAEAASSGSDFSGVTVVASRWAGPNADTQKAIAWAVENDLLKAAKDNGETYVDTDSVSRVEVIRVWNKAQEK